jgi:protein O-mannosyl-transferase
MAAQAVPSCAAGAWDHKHRRPARYHLLCMPKKRGPKPRVPRNIQPQNIRPQNIQPRGIAAFVLILCAATAAYWPALQGTLLWDDERHVTRPDLQSLHGLWRIWFRLGATQQYYPVLHSAFWLEHRFWGDSVLGYHIINVSLHALSAYLLMRIMRRLSLPGAWLGGLIFALHPVCVEAVAWISEQKSTLSAVFYLAAALVYLDFDETLRSGRYWLAAGLFVLALGSKTVTATLPAVLLVILWWRRGRLEWKRDVAPLLPWFAVAVPAGLFTAWVERTIIGAHGSAFALTVPQRLLLAGRVVWFYAWKVVWPAGLAFSYPHWKVDPAVWWQWLFPAGVLAVGCGLCLAARRHRGPLASFLIFVGTLAPVLGFLNVLPFRYSYVADHFQYLASLAIIVPAAAALQRNEWRPLWRIGLPAALLMVLGGMTWRQSAMYTDLETLYRETLARNPESWLARNNLGLLLVQQPGGVPDAIQEYRAAVRLEPDYPESHFNLGSALAHSDPPDRLAAIAEYRNALRLKPDYAEAHNNLGNALTHVPGGTNEAIAEFQAALRIEPDAAEIHANLAGALAQIPGRQQDAIAECRAALRIRPDFAPAQQLLEELQAAR